MKISIQSVRFDASAQLKEFIEKKTSKLEKFSDLIIDAEITLKVIKPEVSNNKEASVKLNIKNGELFASKTADSFEEAIMLNIEALEKQILKTKKKPSLNNKKNHIYNHLTLNKKEGSQQRKTNTKKINT